MRGEMRIHRGFSLSETVIALGITTMVLGLFLTFLTGGFRLLALGTADASTQSNEQWAFQMIARDMRAARGLVSVNSSFNDITIRLPAYDSGGNLVLPIADGDTVRYYLNNGQLTRVEAGTTNSTQVLVKSLGTGGTFIASPAFVDENGDGVYEASEMRAVTIRLTVVQQVGGSLAHPTRSYDARETVALQNRVPNMTPTSGASYPNPSPDNPGASEEW